jgi:hypothetical protein
VVACLTGRVVACLTGRVVACLTGRVVDVSASSAGRIFEGDPIGNAGTLGRSFILSTKHRRGLARGLYIQWMCA